MIAGAVIGSLLVVAVVVLLVLFRHKLTTFIKTFKKPNGTNVPTPYVYSICFFIKDLFMD